MSVNKAVWLPASLGLVMKILTGLLGAWAFALVFPDGSTRANSDDILSVLLHDTTPRVSQYAAYLWDITTLVPGIPVLAIMVRYNLLSGRVCGRTAAFFWGVVAPWLVAMFCYESDVLVQFCNWVAIVVQGYINFVVPVLLYRVALQRYPQETDFVETEESTRKLLETSVNEADDLDEPLMPLSLEVAMLATRMPRCSCLACRAAVTHRATRASRLSMHCRPVFVCAADSFGMYTVWWRD